MWGQKGRLALKKAKANDFCRKPFNKTSVRNRYQTHFKFNWTEKRAIMSKASKNFVRGYLV